MPPAKVWERVEEKILLAISGQQIKFLDFGQLTKVIQKTLLKYA